MEIKRFADLERFAPGKLSKVNVFESQRFFLDLYCLEPGQAQRRHAHPGCDKVYTVLEGEAAVTVAGETAVLRPGEAVLAGSGEEHGVENRSDARAVLLVFMAPHPDARG
jgi:quercetin dioxygenase-like cupin family protein